MREVSSDASEIIFREGDAADAVYLLRAGEVEVVRENQGAEVRITVLRDGEIFGEMSVLRSEPRSTTLRALVKTRAVAIPMTAFFEAFLQDSPFTLKVLCTLCGRLIDTNEMMIESQAPASVTADDFRRIRLLPDSNAIAAQIGAEGVSIDAFPFEVGGHIRAGKPPRRSSHGLTLRHAGDHHIATRQFCLEFLAGRLHLRDLGSPLGTLVNDTRVARFKESDIVPLDLGETLVQASGEDSPYRFRLLVEAF